MNARHAFRPAEARRRYSRPRGASRGGCSRWAGGALASVLLAASAPGLSEALVMQRQHHEWSSGAVVDERPVRFRAFVERLESGTYTRLNVDLLEGHCTERHTEISVLLPAPLEQQLSNEPRSAEVRIDRRPVRPITYRLATRNGGRHLLIKPHALERDDAFWREMATGRTMRLRFSTERKVYFLRFALLGHREAMRRVEMLCRAPSGHDSRIYFEQR
jgi:hypothetical protein